MKILNRLTGQVFNTDSKISDYKFKRVCKGLERKYNEIKGLQLYFLTLTLSDKDLEVCNKNLHKFIEFLQMRFRRSKLPFYYVWVVELQWKRYLKYGKLARHWHFVILAPVGSLPDVEFRQYQVPHYKIIRDGSLVKNKDLFIRWGYGQVFCKSAWSRDVYNYLGKYLEKQAKKGGGSGSPFALASRRFGSSNFKYFSYPNWAYDYCVIASKKYDDFVSIKTGSKLNIIGLDSSGDIIEKVVLRSPYKRFTVYDEFSHIEGGDFSG